MHSASSRFNSILLYTAIVLSIACMVYYGHGRLMLDPKPIISLQIGEAIVFTNSKNWQQISYIFSLHAGTKLLQVDLSSLQNWNLKQLYVYVLMEWTTTNKQQQSNNSAIVSDWLITNPLNQGEVAKAFTIDVKAKKFQYSVRDVHHSLRNNTAIISLNVQHMPKVGYIEKTRLYQSKLILPINFKNQNNS